MPFHHPQGNSQRYDEYPRLPERTEELLRSHHPDCGSLCNWHSVQHPKHSFPIPSTHNSYSMCHLQNRLRLFFQATPALPPQPVMSTMIKSTWQSHCKSYTTLTQKYITRNGPLCRFNNLNVPLPCCNHSVILCAASVPGPVALWSMNWWDWFMGGGRCPMRAIG